MINTVSLAQCPNTPSFKGAKLNKAADVLMCTGLFGVGGFFAKARLVDGIDILQSIPTWGRVLLAVAYFGLAIKLANSVFAKKNNSCPL